MANLITSGRLLLLLVVILVTYHGSAVGRLVNVLLLIAVFVSDGLDGYIARKRGECSLFGAIYDVAADRTVELCLWVMFAHLGALPVWIPLIFIARGVLVDAIRAAGSGNRREAPFAQIHSHWGRALVAGRFMRGFYAVLKAVTFCLLMLCLPLPALAPAAWRQWGPLLYGTALGLAYLSTCICLLRGAPVVGEFLTRERRTA